MKNQLKIFLISIISTANFYANGQTQTQDLNMGTHELQFSSASGGSNRIQSSAGSGTGTWLFKSRFDNMILNAGENSSNPRRIIFQIGDIERARIHSSGYFGIGTQTPLYKLDVNGTGRFTDNLTIDGNVGIGTGSPISKLSVNGRGAFGNELTHVDWTYENNWGGSAYKWAGYIGFNAYRNNDDTKDYYYGKNQYTNKGVIEGSNNGFRFLYRKHQGNDSNGQHQLSELMRLNSDGKLGIGTTAPYGKLEISTDIWSNSLLTLRDTHYSNQVYHFQIESDGLKIKKENSVNYNFTSDGDFIVRNGNIGIGTTPTSGTFGYRLAVNGKIGSKEVKVEISSPWPDYVFSKNYNLKTLEETENYINENHHLPEIPSASEVEENGILLGEMNAKLLQKIEELTLHLIDQNKRNEAQSEQIKTLTQRLNELEGK